MNASKRQVTIDIIVFLIIGLFVYAAVSKLIDYDRFEATIGKSPLITNHARWLAPLIPFGELGISLALLLPKFRMIGLYMSFILMLTFTIYIAYILTFSPYIPCSCGGILNNMGWTEHLFFNVVYTIITLLGIIAFNPNDYSHRSVNTQQLV